MNWEELRAKLRARRHGLFLSPLRNRFRQAEQTLVCGILHLKLPCEMCGTVIWTAASNTRCVCNDCVPESVSNYTDGQIPAEPVVRKPLTRREGRWEK